MYMLIFVTAENLYRIQTFRPVPVSIDTCARMHYVTIIRPDPTIWSNVVGFFNSEREVRLRPKVTARCTNDISKTNKQTAADPLHLVSFTSSFFQLYILNNGFMCDQVEVVHKLTYVLSGVPERIGL